MNPSSRAKAATSSSDPHSHTESHLDPSYFSKRGYDKLLLQNSNLKPQTSSTLNPKWNPSLKAQTFSQSMPIPIIDHTHQTQS
jgi:hypothetical protein